MREENNNLLTESEVAEYIGFTVRALQAWRQLGRGPKAYRIANKGIRYKLKDVMDWIESKKINQDGEV